MSKSSRRLASNGLALSLLLIGTMGCAAKSFVSEHPLQGGDAASTLSPHDGRRMMEEALRDTTNLLGGRWETKIHTLSVSCDAAGGSSDEDGVYYMGVAYRQETMRDLNASAEAFSRYWNSRGDLTWSASYVEDDKQVFSANSYGNRTTLTVTAENTLVLSDGPCTPGNERALREVDIADLEKTASPTPTP